MQRRSSTLYGRRKGKPLSPRREGLMAGVYRQLAVDLATPPPAPLATLFPAPVDDIRLEIGFGGGEHLIHEASAAPATGFIGVEPFIEAMAKAVAAIDLAGLTNIRLHDGDAADLLDWLPPASLARVDLLYPDPWPKRRHWKRRFVNPDNLDRIARALAPGALFRFASDIDTYVDWTLRHLAARPDFVWTAERADDWRKPWAGWPGTRYEAKAYREGRTPAYLVFRKR
ncbi:tRNA (guanosine(46)-N7)-methyltransferase TrmB [Bauldia litoralis]|nr:tRNA (guanosine(46)-N7)-methyltransferase TrmB [Bauldia litoralis]